MNTDDWIVAPDKPLPHQDGCFVEVIATIRENATGRTAEYETIAYLNKRETVPSDYIWSDGNYGCDCNRGLFFWRGFAGIEYADVECGDGRYSVSVRNKKTGAVFYSELEDA